MTKIYSLLVLCLFLFIGNSHAQLKCGAQQLHEDKLYHDAEYAKGWEQFQRQRIEWMNQAQSRTDGSNCAGGLKTIPVVIHYEYNPQNATERTCLINLANAQITHLNQAFSGALCQNVSPNMSASGGCLRFVIANTNHPANANIANGQPAIIFNSPICPNGTDQNGNPSYIPCAVPEWKGYLNLVVKIPIEGLAGIANLPPTSSIDLIDGANSTNTVVMSSCAFGVGTTGCTPNFIGGANCQGLSSTGGTTVTHEFGHFLGLPHTFCADAVRDANMNTINNSVTNGSLPDATGCEELRFCGNQAPNGPGCVTNQCDCDGFADTPAQAYAQYGAPCDAPGGVLPNPSTGIPYFYGNFMDYVDDKCMSCFSTMQANQISNRARAAANDAKPNVFMDGNNPPTPTVCPPNLAGFSAPQVTITNSTCPAGQATPSGGSFTAPAGCPAGSTIQYSTDQGQTWSNTLPQYDQVNPMFVDTRCLCDTDNTVFSTAEVFVRTAPGACMGGNPPACPPNLAGFAAPGVTVTNSTCPAGQATPSGGSFTAPAGCPAGSTIQYSTDQGQTWSNNLPQYDQVNAMFVDTRCLCDTDNTVFSTAEVFVQTNPSACGGAPPIAGDGGESWCVDEARFAGGEGQITVSNLITEREIVAIIGEGTGWQERVICDGNCADNQVIDNLASGSYQVKLQMFESSDNSYCYREETIVVTEENVEDGGNDINCNEVLVSSTDNQIEVNNLPPNAILKVYLVKANGGWDLVGDCHGDCGASKIFSNLADGNYIVSVELYTANFKEKICETPFDIIVGSDGGSATPNCDNLNFTASNGRIKVSGINAPVAQIKLYQVKAEGGWDLVERCNDDCGTEQTFANLSAGNYLVDVVLYTANYAARICGVNQMVTLGNALNRSAISRSNQLLELAAYKNKRAVALQWLTNTGYKNSHFEIEKSTNGTDFEPLLKVVNKAKDTGVLTYLETDKNPQLGTNYYRLKQNYVDGSYDYSPIQQVDFAWDISKISIFPNPAKDLININLGQKMEQKATVQVMDALGKVYLEQTFEKSENTALQIPIQQLNNGLYYMTIKVDNQKMFSKKLVVNRWY